MIQYTLGFMLSRSLKSVLVINKKRGLHIGLINGIGGRLGEGEDPLDGMIREAKEETCIDLPTAWSHYATLSGVSYVDGTASDHFRCWCFCQSMDNLYSKVGVISTEEGRVYIEDVRSLILGESLIGGAASVSNMPWLLFMAINYLRGATDYIHLIAEIRRTGCTR